MCRIRIAKSEDVKRKDKNCLNSPKNTFSIERKTVNHGEKHISAIDQPVLSISIDSIGMQHHVSKSQVKIAIS